MEDLVLNCGLGVKSNARRGREVQINGPKLFNSIPKKIWALTKVSVEEFKEHLDRLSKMNRKRMECHPPHVISKVLNPKIPLWISQEQTEELKLKVNKRGL